MSDYKNKINHQYAMPNLIDSIRKTVLKTGNNIETLTSEDISGFDELHVGGQVYSEKLFKNLSLMKNSRVLDCGSGLGGPARLLSKLCQVKVTGIDLTKDFTAIAHKLSSALDMSDLTQFTTGNVLSMPFTDSTFDTVLNQHFCMNIPDKETLYREIGRVLKPDGFLVIHEIFKGEHKSLNFPVPWARDKSISHLISLQKFQSLLKDNKFTEIYCKDISEESLEWYHQIKTSGKKPSPLNQFLIFGKDLKKMVKNMQANISDNKIKIIQAIYKKNK